MCLNKTTIFFVFLSLGILLCGIPNTRGQIVSNTSNANEKEGDNKGNASFTLEARWSYSLDPFNYPWCEVYITNHTVKSVKLGKWKINGKDATNSGLVVWSRYLPSDQINPGQSAVLRFSAKLVIQDNPAWVKSSENKVLISLDNEKDLEINLPPVIEEWTRITSLTASSNYKTLFIGYGVIRWISHPVKIKINGKEIATENWSQLSQPIEDWDEFQRTNYYGKPGLIKVKMPEDVKLGSWIWVRMEMDNGAIIHTSMKISSGVLIDAFGVEKSQGALRKELGLDLNPYAGLIDRDLSCQEMELGTPGKLAEWVISQATQRSAGSPENLNYIYLCTAAAANSHYPLYSAMTDGLGFCRYTFSMTKQTKFVEKEEFYCRVARRAAAPKPFIYIPETFTYKNVDRILEPGELRLLLYTAIGNGCKGVNYFIYGNPGEILGFQSSPILLEEIKRLNKEIKNLEPILSPALFYCAHDIGDKVSGQKTYELWSGDTGVLLIMKNMDYTTDRNPNDMGKNPRFSYKQKADISLVIKKPEWLNLKTDNEGNFKAVNPLTMKSLTGKFKDGNMLFVIPNLELTEVIWIQNIK